MCQKSTIILFILHLIALTMIHQTTSSPTFQRWGNFCDYTTMFANNSPYQTNLNTLFRALSSNATNNPSGYHQAVANNPGTETIYGHYLCRGDMNLTACHDCVAFATNTDLPNTCPNRKIADIAYDECLVRYSNQSFFGNMDPFILGISWNVLKIIGNNTRFMEKVYSLISNKIAMNAAVGGFVKKFATEFANYSVLQPIYVLGQCTPDLMPSDCYNCINSSIDTFQTTPGGRFFSRSCIVRYEIYPFFNLSYLPPPPQPPQPSPSPSSASDANPVSKTDGRKKKVSTKLIVSIIAAIVVFSATLFLICICLLKKKSRKTDVTNPTEMTNQELNAESLQYNLATLLWATDNFSDENKLGEGGFGAVYRGTLPNGQLIAVKRLSIGSIQGIQEFKTEALLVAKLQHRNLVRLLGFCYAVEEKLLVYEYMANKC